MIRVLKSVSNAKYSDDEVTLILSIDKSEVLGVKKYAENFEWVYGEKIVVSYEERQGLKKHILKSGDFLDSFDAMVVLEDDIYVSPDYYNYFKQAVNFYESDERIAGISLYNHHWQIDSDRPFIPASSKYDTYFLQYAQSWGQIWLKKQWFEFIKWYSDNHLINIDDPNIPRNLKYWPDSSWLKHHINYCIQKQKYFVYPYNALSTNFTEVGQHNQSKSTKYQVPMMYDVDKQYNFATLEENTSVVYDAFFERKFLGHYIGLPSDELTVDLYGRKSEKVFTKYLLTMEPRNYKIEKTFSLELKPHEMNIILDFPGNEIKLYNTHVQEVNKPFDSEIIKWEYDVRSKNIYRMLSFITNRIKEKLFKK